MKNMTRTTILTASAVALLGATSASAATSAFATTDLNLRAGPGPQYEIIGVIDGRDATSVEGCLADSNWCKVSYEGTTGWAYGDYLAHQMDSTAPIYAPEAEVEVDSVTFKEPGGEGAAVGALTGAAIAASAAGGPIGIIGGFLIGSGVGGLADMEETTVTYIRNHPVDPVYGDGEIVVGAKLSENAPLTPIPDSEYTYIKINNTLAVVEPVEREVVYILR